MSIKETRGSMTSDKIERWKRVHVADLDKSVDIQDPYQPQIFGIKALLLLLLFLFFG